MTTLDLDPGALGLGSPHGSAFGKRGLLKRLSMLAAIALPTGGYLLDLGCGPGTYTFWMARSYDRAVGVDVDPARVEALVQENPMPEKVAGIVGSAESLLFPDACFDAVTAIEVLEHVPGLSAALGEVHRVLTPGGLFFFTTPNRWFPVETHGVVYRGRRHRGFWAAPFVTWFPPVHRRVSGARAFTRKELLAVCHGAGLQLVGSSYMNPPFDRRKSGKRIRWATDRLESTRAFGWLSMTHVMVFRKGEN